MTRRLISQQEAWQILDERNALRDELDAVRKTLTLHANEKLRAEVDELKAKLAVFTEGVPNGICLQLTANELDGLGVYDLEAKWLRRIAEVKL